MSEFQASYSSVSQAHPEMESSKATCSFSNIIIFFREMYNDRMNTSWIVIKKATNAPNAILSNWDFLSESTFFFKKYIYQKMTLNRILT